MTPENAKENTRLDCKEQLKVMDQFTYSSPQTNNIIVLVN